VCLGGWWWRLSELLKFCVRRLRPPKVTFVAPFLEAVLLVRLAVGEPDAKISVTTWDTIEGDPEKLRFLIDATFTDRASCKYNLSRAMRRADS
jgi:hypothetical protein